MWLEPPIAALLATWGYAWRELDQQIRKMRKGHNIQWTDAIMDVASPAVASFALARWLS